MPETFGLKPICDLTNDEVIAHLEERRARLRADLEMAAVDLSIAQEAVLMPMVERMKQLAAYEDAFVARTRGGI